ncbi:MAG: hypothetical protein AVDCRST_MAG64-2607, partial [uncultured Phycisphaerae bacterium]
AVPTRPELAATAPRSDGTPLGPAGPRSRPRDGARGAARQARQLRGPRPRDPGAQLARAARDQRALEPRDRDPRGLQREVRDHGRRQRRADLRGRRRGDDGHGRRRRVAARSRLHRPRRRAGDIPDDQGRLRHGSAALPGRPEGGRRRPRRPHPRRRGRSRAWREVPRHRRCVGEARPAGHPHAPPGAGGRRRALPDLPRGAPSRLRALRGRVAAAAALPPAQPPQPARRSHPGPPPSGVARLLVARRRGPGPRRADVQRPRRLAARLRRPHPDLPPAPERPRRARRHGHDPRVADGRPAVGVGELLPRPRAAVGQPGLPLRAAPGARGPGSLRAAALAPSPPGDTM